MHQLKRHPGKDALLQEFPTYIAVRDVTLNLRHLKNTEALFKSRPGYGTILKSSKLMIFFK